MRARDMVLVVAILASAGALLTSSEGLVAGRPVAGLVAGLVAAVVVFSAVWPLSLVLRDASIVDVLWGPAVALLGWFHVVWIGEGPTWHGLVLACMVTVWGGRLGAHLAVRNAERGEDARYAEWRRRAGRGFWWISYFKVFLLQAVIAWIVSSPVAVAQLGDREVGIGGLAWLGVGLWLLGLLYESVADWQLLRFQREPESRGRVLDQGLWALSRHPNYLGEALLWWGAGLVALDTGNLRALIGPALLTYLLVAISGVSMLDESLARRRPGYEEYIRSTPALIPWSRRARRAAP